MVSPFFNRFKLKNKSDRIIQNYDNVPEKGVIRPELLTRPNVGYLKVDRAGNEEVLPPLNTNSEYARRIRSLGAWEKAREAPTIPPAKYEKIITNKELNSEYKPLYAPEKKDQDLNWFFQKRKIEQPNSQPFFNTVDYIRNKEYNEEWVEPPILELNQKADEFRNKKLKSKVITALINNRQEKVQKKEQESIADAFRRRKLLEKGAIGIGENKRSEQEDRAAERAREIYTAQKEKEQEVIASKFKETQKAVADNFRRRKLLEKGILGIEDNRISEQRAKAADDFRRHKLLKKGMLGIDQNRISEQETKAAEEKRNKYARGLELLDRFSNNKQNEALRTGFDALNNNTKEQREQEAIAAQREKERLAAEEKRNKYAKGLELLGKFGNRKQDEDLRNRFDAIGDRANEVNAQREKERLAAEEKRNRYVKGLELLGRFEKDAPKEYNLNTRGRELGLPAAFERDNPTEYNLNTREIGLPTANLMMNAPRQYNHTSTGYIPISEEDKRDVMGKFAKGFAKRLEESKIARDKSSKHTHPIELPIIGRFAPETYQDPKRKSGQGIDYTNKPFSDYIDYSTGYGDEVTVLPNDWIRDIIREYNKLAEHVPGFPEYNTEEYHNLTDKEKENLHMLKRRYKRTEMIARENLDTPDYTHVQFKKENNNPRYYPQYPL